MVRETSSRRTTSLHPVFVTEGRGVTNRFASMPEQSRSSMICWIKEAHEVSRFGHSCNPVPVFRIKRMNGVAQVSIRTASSNARFGPR